MNSLIVTIVITVGRVFFDSLAGYALSRLKFRGRGIVFASLVAVMAVPAVVLLIPRFLILKQFGLYDSYAGMIVPLLVDAAGIFIMKQFFESIPVGVEEAARLDGAGIFRTFWTIVLPMARPALVTLFILSFQGSWNEFGHFIVSRQNPDLNTLTTGIASLFSGQLGSSNAVSAEDGDRGAHDDSGRRALLHLPKAPDEHHRGRRKGLARPPPRLPAPPPRLRPPPARTCSCAR